MSNKLYKEDTKKKKKKETEIELSWGVLFMDVL